MTRAVGDRTRRRRGGNRCRYDHKHTFRSYRKAQQAAARLPDPGQPYWCPFAGGWHIRRGTQSDYDRRRAQYLAEWDGAGGGVTRRDDYRWRCALCRAWGFSATQRQGEDDFEWHYQQKHTRRGERVISGEISPNAAARQMGWRRPRIIVSTPERTAAHLRKYMTPDQLAELARLLLEGVA